MIKLISYWKEILVIALIVLLVLLWNSFGIAVKKIEFLEEQTKTLKIDNDNMKLKITVFEEAAIQQDENHAKAEAERLAIIKSMSAQIGRLKDQTPPKECEKAVEWAIHNKGDLKWQK
jgi:hypothetical protein